MRIQRNEEREVISGNRGQRREVIKGDFILLLKELISILKYGTISSFNLNKKTKDEIIRIHHIGMGIGNGKQKAEILNFYDMYMDVEQRRTFKHIPKEQVSRKQKAEFIIFTNICMNVYVLGWLISSGKQKAEILRFTAYGMEAMK